MKDKLAHIAFMSDYIISREPMNIYVPMIARQLNSQYTIYELNYESKQNHRGNAGDNFTLHFPQRYLNSPTHNQLHK